MGGFTEQWDAPVANIQTHATPGSNDVFYDGPKQLASQGSLSLAAVAAAGEGCHTAHVRAWDNARNFTLDDTYGPLCFDDQKPILTCGFADTLWHATNQDIECLAFDSLSGLANAADADFKLSTNVAAGVETANAFTNRHDVLDVAGNDAIAGPIGPFMIDRKPPSI